jgi:beta-mannosidase
MVVTTFGSNTNYFYFESPKHLLLKQQPIEKEITKSKNGFIIKISSKTLQKNVFLFTKVKGHFSDNYFDLLPNETVLIEFETEANTLDDLKLKSLNDLII